VSLEPMPVIALQSGGYKESASRPEGFVVSSIAPSSAGYGKRSVFF
jgi:hypothetical protein